MLTLPERLRTYRQARRLSIRTVADAAGMAASTYGQKEQGKYPFDADELDRLARVYQKSLAELLTGTHPTLVCACGATVLTCATIDCQRHQTPPRQTEVCDCAGATPVLVVEEDRP